VIRPLPVPGPLPPLLSRRARVLIVLGYLLILGVVVIDLLSGPGSTYSPLLAAVPVLASVSTRRPAVPLLAGLAAIVAVGALALVNDGVSAVVHITAAVTVLAVTCTSVATVVLVSARERELATVRGVSEATQQALLRPPPPRIGELRVAVRYVAAQAQARIGGDLYEIVRTPWGVRLLLGDVRGKGLAAVETVADVLGVFREAARSEPRLPVVARRLDAALARRVGDGDDDETAMTAEFVTAILVGFEPSGGSAAIVNCGHPPPLLRHHGTVREVRPARYAPPLALLDLVGGDYPADHLTLDDGDELLLFTDGVSEARDAAGRLYPLAGRLASWPGLDPDALLDRVLADVRRHTGGGLDDDAALLAVRREL
jgi:serine phosphatase RsbU (regulator of sigma subunit)